jgi:ABC-type nitrate/sulfonate/bicarbonate transport system substrate-binding protein
MSKQSVMTRRHTLVAVGAAGAGMLTGLSVPPHRVVAAEAIRQGYQTNIWGMPTYYLIKSGYLQKHGLSVEEFAVPSGNITMQQMVAGQVDLGTYAGPSFIIGNVKGGLIAIAVIENVGKTSTSARSKNCAGGASPTWLAPRSATISTISSCRITACTKATFRKSA